ncbi:hypothetical protein NC653_030227 [Populus alba x Populus x berolinensis]|uniref:Uncharacterized protein n=1 Tax=Populus alba x Populus x berolinensis TaxID=444605 RepID=A0AAD6Q066_9ROSI|nr:hypothetical protein NC653_030227 [Populus alba x Populus x berolinensis]
MKRGFEESLDCNNSHLAGSVNNLHLPFHTHNPMLIEVLSLSLQTWPHTSSVLVVTGLVTGCAPGTVIGAGVVTGLLIGAGGLTEGFAGGKSTVTGLAGLVAGTVTIVGAGVSGRRVPGGVDPGFVGKTVGVLIISSCKVVLKVLSEMKERFVHVPSSAPFPRNLLPKILLHTIQLPDLKPRYFFCTRNNKAPDCHSYGNIIGRKSFIPSSTSTSRLVSTVTKDLVLLIDPKIPWRSEWIDFKVYKSFGKSLSPLTMMLLMFTWGRKVTNRVLNQEIADGLEFIKFSTKLSSK